MTSLAGSKAPRVQRPGREPTIADLVEVTAVETVVHLDGRPGRLSELVLTADVVAALSAVLGAARQGRGEAFFLVGHFGSGKSHLLAALAELVGGPGQELPAGWDRPLREAAGALGPALAVAIPLVEHRAGAVLEDLVLSKAWEALGRPVGQQPPGGTDRRAAWDTLLSAAAGTGRGTLVVALDELSEFLRAKQAPALIEDLRFLQFLGEWATGRPVVVVAALQESIEEVANVSQRELTRIRDRYRTLALSMRHVEDLVRGRLLRLRPGAEASIEQAHRRPEQGRLAGSVRPEDRDDLAPAEARRDPAQDLVTAIAGPDVPIREPSDAVSLRRPRRRWFGLAAGGFGARRQALAIRLGTDAIEDDLERQLDGIRVGDPEEARRRAEVPLALFCRGDAVEQVHVALIGRRRVDRQRAEQRMSGRLENTGPLRHG